MAQGFAAIVESPEGDIIVSQGADNAYGFTWKRDGEPVQLELEEWVLKAQIRKAPGSTPWVTLTQAEDAAGSVIVVNNSGEIVVYLDHQTTEDPAWNSALRKSGVWDLEAFRPETGEKVRIVMGNVTVSPDITREV